MSKTEGITSVLTVHEATIHSMQVEIQTLRVGTKHVTMGLFRQLPMQALFSVHTLEFRGTPWGWVNYFWDDCFPREERDWIWPAHTSLQVVWQDKTRLYRAVCRSKPPERIIGQPDAFASLQEPAFQDRWRQKWFALHALPQLFIAV